MWSDGIPAAALFNGPQANYTAAAAASSSAQSLIAQVSGNFQQASVPADFFAVGTTGRKVVGRYAGILTGQATATTAIITLGFATSAQSVSGTSLVASTAITVTSLSAVGWQFDFDMLSRGTGQGTTATSSTILCTGTLSLATLQSVCAPVTVTNWDATGRNWLYATVTFSTASATNSCTLESTSLYGFA